jgi:integrase
MEDVGKYPGLKLRGTTYYLRVRVPADLLEAYAPQTEIWRSLRTKNHKDAVERWRVARLKLDQEFDEDRARLKAAQQGGGAQRVLSDTEVERLAELYFFQRIGRDDTNRLNGFSNEEFEELSANVDEALSEFRRGIARNNLDEVEPEIEEFLVVHPEVNIGKGTGSYRRLAQAIYKANIRSLEVIKARNEGQIVETPKLEPLKTNAPLLSQAFERWRVEHQGPQKTVNEFLAQIRRFISLHGDLPIDRITKAHVREFKDAMLKWPANLSNAERRRPVPEVLKAYEGLEVPQLSPKTINEKCLAPLKAVLAHCENDGLIESNPAVGIRAKEPKVKKVSVLPYSNEDIRTILAWPIFTESARPKGGGGEAAKWLPLLAMFSGARLEEIATLHREDFGVEDGVQFMGLTRRVKNEASRRKIPIHSQLIAFGFLRYVESFESGPIFPLLGGQSEKVSASWSKWWSRYARANGITDHRKVFHSFRHTVKLRMKNAGVDKTLRDAVMGHTAKDEAERYGRDEDGLGFALAPLSQAIEAVSYPVSFEHLSRELEGPLRPLR